MMAHAINDQEQPPLPQAEQPSQHHHQQQRPVLNEIVGEAEGPSLLRPQPEAPNDNNLMMNIAAGHEQAPPLQAAPLQAAPAQTRPAAPMAMKLTNAECRRALSIKNAALQDPSLRELSDYEYAQYALATPGSDLEAVLYRIQGMQTFREEYKIQDTLEEGMRLCKAFHQQQPWFVLDVEYEPQHGHFVCVYDYGVVNPKAVRLPEEWRVYLGGLYYIFQLLQANLGSVREGLVHICECEGTKWKRTKRRNGVLCCSFWFCLCGGIGCGCHTLIHTAFASVSLTFNGSFSICFSCNDDYNNAA